MRMEEALDADGCAIVRSFFGFLIDAKERHGKFNISKVMKTYVLVKTGPKKYNNRQPSVWKDEKRREVTEMLNNGVNFADVGKRFNVSEKSVRNALYRLDGLRLSENKLKGVM